jgi:hypothetical protein
LDECEGATVYDSGDSGVNGTITTGGSVGTCGGSTGEMRYDGAIGKYNNALDFDGSSDYVTINSGPAIGNQGTVTAWVKTDTTAATRSDIISYDADYNPYRLRMSRNGSTFQISIGDQNLVSTSGSISSTSTWYQTTLVWDNGTYYAYLNGIQVGTGSYSTFTDSTVNYYIGSYYTAPSNLWNGLIDDVRIYNYALSADQIKTVMNGDAGVRFGPETGRPLN